MKKPRSVVAKSRGRLGIQLLNTRHGFDHATGLPPKHPGQGGFSSLIGYGRDLHNCPTSPQRAFRDGIGEAGAHSGFTSRPVLPILVSIHGSILIVTGARLQTVDDGFDPPQLPNMIADRTLPISHSARSEPFTVPMGYPSSSTVTASGGMEPSGRLTAKDTTS